MAVFVCDCHFLYDLFDILICGFDNTIYLRSVRRRIMVLYLELFTELGDHCVVEICTIVSNNPLWYTISIDQIVSDKPRHDILGYCSKGSCLDPLREKSIATSMKRCPLDAVGLISPIMLMPHIAKGQGAIKMFRGTGGTCTLSA